MLNGAFALISCQYMWDLSHWYPVYSYGSPLLDVINSVLPPFDDLGFLTGFLIIVDHSLHLYSFIHCHHMAGDAQSASFSPYGSTKSIDYVTKLQ